MTAHVARRGNRSAAADRYDVRVALQPIIDVATGVVVAVEALARFDAAPYRPADEVIADAHATGAGHELEAACVRAALARRTELPPGIGLTVNVSPDALVDPVVAACWDVDLTGVIVEVTEHRASDTLALQEQFGLLRARGAQIAVDDVGTGYAGLLRLATMRPDIVKLDRTIVSSVRTDAAQAAVLEALVAFSHRMGAAVIGEGVESVDDLTALAEFDVDLAQGWAVGRPSEQFAAVSSFVVGACRRARAVVLQRRGRAGSAAARSARMHMVAEALANATGMVTLHTAAAGAAQELGVDVICASVLGPDDRLREVTSSGAALDPCSYAIADYPATRAVIETGEAVEVHLNDPQSDPAERAILQRIGRASLLMVPLTVAGHRIGVLEFLHGTHRRWTTGDIVHARGLAAHLGNALARISG